MQSHAINTCISINKIIIVYINIYRLLNTHDYINLYIILNLFDVGIPIIIYYKLGTYYMKELNQKVYRCNLPHIVVLL